MQFEFEIKDGAIKMTIYGPTYKGVKVYSNVQEIIEDLSKMGRSTREIMEISDALYALEDS